MTVGGVIASLTLFRPGTATVTSSQGTAQSKAGLAGHRRGFSGRLDARHYPLAAGSGFMVVLCKPATAVPDYVITSDDTLELARTLHRSHPKLSLILQPHRTHGVLKRHLIQRINKVLQHPGFDVHSTVHEKEPKARVPDVVRWALDQAKLDPQQIDLIIYVSCTGFMMPSLIAWLSTRWVPARGPADTDRATRLRCGRRGRQPSP